MYDVWVIKLAHNQRFHHEICFGLRHGQGGYGLDGDGVFLVASVFVHALKHFAESTLAKGSSKKRTDMERKLRVDSVEINDSVSVIPTRQFISNLRNEQTKSIESIVD